MSNSRRYLLSGLTRFGAIPYDELDLTGSVNGGDLADATITAGKLAADAVSDANVDAISVAKLTPGSSGQVLTVDTGETAWADVDALPPTPATARFAGEVSWHAGATAPSGWLVADGSSYLRADHPDLFTAIGTLHGAADGTHFNVPNLVGAHPKGSAANGSNVGSTGGADTVTIATGNLPAHAHAVGTLANSSDSAGTPAGSVSIATESSHTHSVSITSGSHSVDHTHSMGHDHPLQIIQSPGGYTGSTPTGGTGAVSDVGGGGIGGPVKMFNGSTGGASTGHTHLVSGATAAGVAHGHAGSTFTGSTLSTHTHTITGSTANAGSGTALNVEAKHVKLLPVIKT